MHLSHSSQMVTYFGTRHPLKGPGPFGDLIDHVGPFRIKGPCFQRFTNDRRAPTLPDQGEAAFMHLKPLTMMMIQGEQ